MRPFADCPADVLRRVRGVITDIDDTLTSGGAIEPAAFNALSALQRAAVPVFAITGRPRGWSESFARDWPLDAIVAENGGVALIPSSTGDVAAADVRVEYAQDAATRAANARSLRRVEARIQREVPGATPARDSPGRATDIAVDHSEFARLSANDIAAVVAVMRDEGMTATVSSIHINGWFGSHTKLTGAAWMLRRLYRRDLHAEVGQWLYVGDSANDQPMFAALPLCVGVANLRDVAALLHTLPAYITEAERGGGFAEVAQALLAQR